MPIPVASRHRCTSAGLRALIVASLLLTLAAPGVGGERWGWFGIRIRDLQETEMEDLSRKLGLTEGYGVMVAELLKDAPAQASGLRQGDLIVAIDGRPVVDTRGLQRIVGATPAGREVRVVVLREGRRRELRVRVGEMPPDAVAERVTAEFGFQVRDPSTEETGPAAGARPPVVGAVFERTPAARGGLAVGDRILAVNGVEVGSVEAFRGLMRELLLNDPIRLGVTRRGEPLGLVLPPAKPAVPIP